jgi:3-oxoacyl-[acyl-carrier-protein] synthase-3
MNGMEIFKFSATDVVKTLSGFMESEGLSAEGLDALFLHQANHFMNDKIARKLKFTPAQVPYTIGFYGNTGSASIPLTIAHQFSTQSAPDRHRALLCGFGVGLSWGVASVALGGICTPPVVELS